MAVCHTSLIFSLGLASPVKTNRKVLTAVAPKQTVSNQYTKFLTLSPFFSIKLKIRTVRTAKGGRNKVYPRFLPADLHPSSASDSLYCTG